MTSIGFIGLGNMGFYMARNLLGCRRKVLAFDSDSPALGNIKVSIKPGLLVIVRCCTSYFVRFVSTA